MSARRFIEELRLLRALIKVNKAICVQHHAPKHDICLSGGCMDGGNLPKNTFPRVEGGWVWERNPLTAMPGQLSMPVYLMIFYYFVVFRPILRQASQPLSAVHVPSSLANRHHVVGASRRTASLGKTCAGGAHRTRARRSSSRGERLQTFGLD